MKLMESLFTDINDINYGCEKGKIDNKEFHRCVKSVMENTLEELETIKNNPFLEYTNDSIGDKLSELKEWIVEDWLNDKSEYDEGMIEELEGISKGFFDQYKKYNLLQDAMEILNEKESK